MFLENLSLLTNIILSKTIYVFILFVSVIFSFFKLFIISGFDNYLFKRFTKINKNIFNRNGIYNYL